MIILHFARPIRNEMASAVGKYWEKMVNTMIQRVNVDRAVAVGIVALAINLVGCCALLSIGVLSASLLSGVPLWR